MSGGAAPAGRVPSPVDIRREALFSEAARALVSALDAELGALYPEEGAAHFRLEAGELAEGRGGFFVAYEGGRPVGCGALRRIAEGTGEIKRMYVVPGRRGCGIAARLLERLEEEACRLGLTRLVLETGSRQEAALALYRRRGYAPIPPFGEYVGSPLSVCLARELSP